ncbi:SOS response-associated peptidase [Membranicola marinus]|uniref:SOS response-associated peptidase n=1 Tax=Membranihabitans marinus TaxID=1227546 RepID=A0A953L9Y8_9BACT|nr:SOS response-associated peptidase family protein [Membranihabitans marinus]MBY5958138.1 SOS response-associated peptidase [Membranihabitans marinus]
MGDLLHYESDNTVILELLEQGIHFSEYLLSHFNIQTGQRYPVIAQSEKPGISMVRWGMENPMLPEAPRLSYLYGPSIEKQESLHTIFRHQRILIPIKKFIYNQDPGTSIIIKHPEDKMLWMAGLWYEDQQGTKGFAVITQDSGDEQRNKIRRIPLFISHKSLINNWLDRKNGNIPDLDKLMVAKTKAFVSKESMSEVES